MGTEVETLISTTLARHPADRHAAALCEIAEQLLTSDRVEDALTCFDRAIGVDGECARAWVGRSSIMSLQGRTREAFGCVSRALDAEPRYLPALMRKAELLRGQGQLAEAIALYDVALDARPDHEEARLARASAVRDAERVDQMRPPRPPSGSQRVDASRSRASTGPQRIDSARPRPSTGPQRIDSSRPRPSTGPQRIDSSRPRISTGPQRIDTGPPGSGRPRDSGRVRGAVLAPDDVALLDEVRALCLAQRNVEAIRALEPLMKRYPESAEISLVSGHVLFALKQLDGALASVERAARSDGRDPDVWKLMVRVLLAMQKDLRAAAIAERLVTLAPRDAEAHRLHGSCLVLAKRYADAIHAYEKVIHYLPDDAAAWLSLGRALRQLRRLSEARMALTKAAALAEENAPSVAKEANELLAQLSSQS